MIDVGHRTHTTDKGVHFSLHMFLCFFCVLGKNMIFSLRKKKEEGEKERKKRQGKSNRVEKKGKEKKEGTEGFFSSCNVTDSFG